MNFGIYLFISDAINISNPSMGANKNLSFIKVPMLKKRLDDIENVSTKNNIPNDDMLRFINPLMA